MTWDAILENWILLADGLCQDFPHLDAQALKRFRGDQIKLESYLADTHQLTIAEAREALAEWMAYRAPHTHGVLAA